MSCILLCALLVADLVPSAADASPAPTEIVVRNNAPYPVQVAVEWKLQGVVPPHATRRCFRAGTGDADASGDYGRRGGWPDGAPPLVTVMTVCPDGALLAVEEQVQAGSGGRAVVWTGNIDPGDRPSDADADAAETIAWGVCLPMPIAQAPKPPRDAKDDRDVAIAIVDFFEHRARDAGRFAFDEMLDLRLGDEKDGRRDAFAVYRYHRVDTGARFTDRRIFHLDEVASKPRVTAEAGIFSARHPGISLALAAAPRVGEPGERVLRVLRVPGGWGPQAEEPAAASPF